MEIESRSQKQLKLVLDFLEHRLGGEVSKVFPDLLLATMDIIHTQYKDLKGRDGYTFNTDDAKERVRSRRIHHSRLGFGLSKLFSRCRI